MKRPGTTCFGILCLLTALDSRAQTLELRAGVPLVSTRGDSSFATSYSPTLAFATNTTGQAGERVSLIGTRPAGFEAGLGLFFSAHVGIELLGAWDRGDLGGTLGDYSVLLNYSSRQPPDYISRPYTSSSVVPGGQPVTAQLAQLTLSANLVGRWALTSRVTGLVSGGVSYLRASGDGQPLDYTVFQLGGHSVLMSDSYKLTYALEPAHAFGVNLGGGLDIGLTSRLAVTIDGRYVAAPEVDLPVAITGLTSDSQVYLAQQDAATIQRTLQPGTVKVSPSRSRLFVGLKLRR